MKAITLAELKGTGYKSRSIKEEIRENLILFQRLFYRPSFTQDAKTSPA